VVTPTGFNVLVLAPQNVGVAERHRRRDLRDAGERFGVGAGIDDHARLVRRRRYLHLSVATTRLPRSEHCPRAPIRAEPQPGKTGCVVIGAVIELIGRLPVIVDFPYCSVIGWNIGTLAVTTEFLAAHCPIDDEPVRDLAVTPVSPACGRSQQTL
jgi:hypothetical protein